MTKAKYEERISNLKEKIKKEEDAFKKERMFLNIFLMPVVGVAIIARFIYEALKHGWELGKNIIEVLG